MVKPLSFLVAVSGKNEKTVAKLLEDPENHQHINHTFKWGSPLTYAVRNKKIGIVKLLINKYNADPNLKTEYSASALDTAIFDEQIDIVELILNKTGIVYYHNIFNIINTGNLELLKLLSKLNINLNSHQEFLYTALTNPHPTKSYIVALYLLENGAPVDGNLFRAWVKSVNTVDTVDITEYTIIAKILNMFLDRGVDINTVYNKSKECILHCVNNVVLAEMILNKGFNKLEHKNSVGLTPLFWHITIKDDDDDDDEFEPNVELIQLFLKYGANINSTSSLGETVVEYVKAEVESGSDELTVVANILNSYIN